jgi:hypothetical protein
MTCNVVDRVKGDQGSADDTAMSVTPFRPTRGGKLELVVGHISVVEERRCAE